MKCFLCHEEQWHSAGKLHKESEILVCTVCGNVVHKKEPSEEADMIQYYRGEPYTDSKGVFHKKGYRPEPNYMNLITTNNKTNYIKIFLREFLTKHKNDKLVCGDVGCATGYVLNFLRSLGHKATGCEYALIYRRFCENFYGIPVPEELPKKYKYDLISIYHVLEHMVEPDVKLKKYVDMLKDGGFMLIATPEWFNKLAEAAERKIGTFEHFFHKDHINLFSRQTLKNLFRHCGLKIIKEDHEQYGQTYLLQKIAEGEKNNITYKLEDWQKKVAYLKRAKTALDLFNQKKYHEALAIEPIFPEAWLRLIYIAEERKEPDKQKQFFEQMIRHGLEHDTRFTIGYGQWFYQRQEYDKALPLFERALNLKPFGDLAMFAGYCKFFLGDFKTAINFFLMAQEITPNKWVDAMDWACKSACQLKTWDERLKDEVVDKLIKSKGITPALVDNFMEGEKPQDGIPEKKEPIKPEIVEPQKMPDVQPTNDTSQQS